MTESIRILAIIMALVLVQAWLVNQDNKALIAELKADQKRICLIRHNMDIHEFKCTVINNKYAEAM